MRLAESVTASHKASSIFLAFFTAAHTPAGALEDAQYVVPKSCHFALVIALLVKRGPTDLHGII